MIWVCIEIVFLKKEQLLNLLRTYYGRIIVVLLLPFVSSTLLGSIRGDLWYWGTFEKHHGYIFYICCIILGLSLMLHTQAEKKRILCWSILSAVIVSLFALLEYTGIFSFFAHAGTSWTLGRTISTLGNPNYLAGYLLMHLPLISMIRKPERYIISALIIAALITTGSAIALIL
jgi:hypothetical protein